MGPRDQAETVARRLKRKGFVVIVDDMPPRPWTFTPKAVLLHHTASTSITSIERERGDIYVLKHGTSDWPAPKVQWYVGRTGRITLIAKGGANHAGTGAGLVKQGIPANLGNQYMWGIEVQSAGLRRDWTSDQIKAVHALTGELVIVMGRKPSDVWRHKDYDDDSGKIDTQYPLDWHRNLVREYIQRGVDEVTPEDIDKIKRVVENVVESKVDDIAEAAAKKLLSSDLFPKREDIDQTVRQALRDAKKEEPA